MAGLGFTLQYPDGRVEQLLVDSERILIGSGAHCEIRLPVELAQVEHVLVGWNGTVATAEARSFTPHPLINGMSFTQAPLLPDSTISIGSMQILVRPQEIGAGAAVIRRKEEKTSPMTYVLAAIAVPLSLYILLEDPPADDTATMPEERPALFAEGEKTCPQAGGVEARTVGETRRRLAESKRERGPFHVQDAVEAVPLFQEAAACFRAAGDTASAQAATASGDALRARLIEDYRARQMRLEHALAVKDLATAQKEVKKLLGMLSGQQHEYVTWLSNLDRRIALKLGKAEE